MTVSRGFEVLGAFKKAAAWGTAVACATDDAIEILSHGVTPSIEHHENNLLGSGPWQKADARGNETNEGSLTTYLKYEGLDVLIAMFMGTAGTPTQLGVDIAYSNDYVLKDDLAGLFGTLCFDNQVNIEEWDSVKLNSMTIRGNSGERLELEMAALARAFSNDSTINTSSSGWTIPANREFVMFNDGRFRMNAQSGAALGSGDEIYVSAFEITCVHNLEAIFRSTDTPGTGSYNSDEPVRNGFGTVTGSFTFPKYEAESIQDWFLANTILKADIEFQGSLIDGTSYNMFRISLPQLIVMENPVNRPGGPERIQQTLNFRATLASSAPTGMTGITKPLHIYVQNARSTDPLA